MSATQRLGGPTEPYGNPDAGGGSYRKVAVLGVAAPSISVDLSDVPKGARRLQVRLDSSVNQAQDGGESLGWTLGYVATLDQKPALELDGVRPFPGQAAQSVFIDQLQLGHLQLVETYSSLSHPAFNPLTAGGIYIDVEFSDSTHTSLSLTRAAITGIIGSTGDTWQPTLNVNIPHFWAGFLGKTVATVTYKNFASGGDEAFGPDVGAGSTILVGSGQIATPEGDLGSNSMTTLGAQVTSGLAVPITLDEDLILNISLVGASSSTVVETTDLPLSQLQNAGMQGHETDLLFGLPSAMANHVGDTLTRVELEVVAGGGFRTGVPVGVLDGSSTFSIQRNGDAEGTWGVVPPTIDSSDSVVSDLTYVVHPGDSYSATVRLRSLVLPAVLGLTDNLFLPAKTGTDIPAASVPRFCVLLDLPTTPGAGQSTIVGAAPFQVEPPLGAMAAGSSAIACEWSTAAGVLVLSAVLPDGTAGTFAAGTMLEVTA